MLQFYVSASKSKQIVYRQEGYLGGHGRFVPLNMPLIPLSPRSKFPILSILPSPFPSLHLHFRIPFWRPVLNPSRSHRSTASYPSGTCKLPLILGHFRHENSISKQVRADKQSMNIQTCNREKWRFLTIVVILCKWLKVLNYNNIPLKELKSPTPCLLLRCNINFVHYLV